MLRHKGGVGNLMASHKAISYAALLDPHRQIVRFAGRASELAELTAWCLDPSPAGLRLITGPSGTGKTRLAVELGRRVDALGWNVEWLADSAHVTDPRAAASDARRLVVVDNADTVGDLTPLVRNCVAMHPGPARLLLIAESLDPWWIQLRAAMGGLETLRPPGQYFSLNLGSRLSTDASEKELLLDAARDFARELASPEPSLELANPPTETCTVLDLHAAALVAVAGSRHGAMVRVDPSTSVTDLLRLEHRCWEASATARGLATGDPHALQATLGRLVAAACLLGADTEEAASALAERVPNLMRDPNPACLLREMLPPRNDSAGWIGQLQPDRLAQACVTNELTTSAEFAVRCLTSVNAQQAPHVVRVLLRACARDLEVREALAAVLGRLDDLVSELDAPVDVLIATLNAIPTSGEMLRGAAAALCDRIVRLLPEDADQAMRAHWLYALGSRLLLSRRSQEAIPHLEHAVLIRRQLALSGDPFDRRQLAASLMTLGGQYSVTGRPADALKVGEEAADIGRSSPSESAAERARLATLLASLGRQYLAAGRSLDALRVCEEAVAIARELHRSDPVRHQAGLAHSLATIASVYTNLGRSDDAAHALEEVLAIQRDLAARSRGSASSLATSLTSLGIRYAALDRHLDALSVTQEAAGIFGRLVASGNDELRGGLALSLISLADRYWKAGLTGDALSATEGAVAHLRILADQAPDQYRRRLALSLSIQGARYLKSGRAADAIRASEEAVSILRNIDNRGSAKNPALLSDSLRTLSAALTASGRRRAAAAARREAEKTDRLRRT